MGETDASTIVRKLSSSKYKSKTKEALWAFNAIVMTDYLLRYVDGPELPGYVRTALNRGEAYHQLKRKVGHALAGQMRGGDDNEIAIWNECGRLVTNIIIFYNAYILSALLEEKEREGNEEAVELLSRISPVACQHLNLGGLFEFNPGDWSFDKVKPSNFPSVFQNVTKQPKKLL